MFDDAIRVIVGLGDRRPAPSVPAELDDLFARLADRATTECAYVVEDAIWAAWLVHPAADATQRMEEAISAIAKRTFVRAESVLNDLIADYPDWAEAWNKRATLYFLQGRDRESIADIVQTLALEPRHFGALSGFAQICLRHDQPDTALIAFDAVLAINPHLPIVQIARDELLVACRQCHH